MTSSTISSISYSSISDTLSQTTNSEDTEEESFDTTIANSVTPKMIMDSAAILSISGSSSSSMEDLIYSATVGAFETQVTIDSYVSSLTEETTDTSEEEDTEDDTSDD